MKLNLTTIVILLNSVAVLGALGTLFYTRFMYQRPQITEAEERSKLDQQEKEKKFSPQETSLVHFKPMTVNIAGNPPQLAPADGTQTQIQGKLHYATFTLSLEIRSASEESKIESVRPLFLDSLLQLFGRKDFQELTTVHGRFLLRNEILDLANDLVKEPVVTNVFFTHFVVQ